MRARREHCLIALSVAALLLASAAQARTSEDIVRRVGRAPGVAQADDRAVGRGETLWIFDADFEDLLGDNAGWTSYDRSESLGHVNYWHRDTIHRWNQNPAHPLGDTTWWCGKCDDCWRQPRGYGNDWLCILERSFPELATISEPDDDLRLEYDQRYACETCYDYGYTEVSADDGETWTTLYWVTDPGFACHPGPSQDWDSYYPGGPGHMTLDLSSYAGQELKLRFRFQSDCCYSSQDQYDNPPSHSFRDGAWQIDNITLYLNDELLWHDDSESFGNNGWVHDSIPPSGQTGVTFARGVYGADFWTGREFACDEGEGWMYAAVDPVTSKVVDGQHSWLVSPPIDVSGAERIVTQWDAWIDFPSQSGDSYNLYAARNDEEDCVTRSDGFLDAGGWPTDWSVGGPEWGTWTADLDYFAGRNWLALMWAVRSDTDPPPAEGHMAGLFLGRQRVGIVTGESETRWAYGEHSPYWPSWADGEFSDWFWEQLYDASFDSAFVDIADRDGVVSALLLASDDAGATWDSYEMHRQSYDTDVWIASPPADKMYRGSEVLYYFEATDGLGNTSTYPWGAPDKCLEFSILPLRATTTEPGILVVDKDSVPIPGEDRGYRSTAEDYVTEALGILGYDYEAFDVEFPERYGEATWGPDSIGGKYYDTQIWITGDSRGPVVKPVDQANLAAWLAQAGEGKERNLLLTGDNIAYELAAAGLETLDFLADWLSVEFVSDGIGSITTDSLPVVRDVAGGTDFMTYDDGACLLRGGCPALGYFDVVQPSYAGPGVETAVEYSRSDMTALPAGVAFTDSTGYQAVTLGFGIERMSEALLPNGHFALGVGDRVDLMANIMEYFGKEATEPPTGTDGHIDFANSLFNARPNPFNPSTLVEFTLAEKSHVTVRVINAAGRVVRTLVDGVADAGPHTIVWDGTTDAGMHAASGVYFVRMEGTADGGSFSRFGKAVLLK